ncbi:MAG: YraN family protein [Oscillospiraceae bacterium]|nr:YraN family protein [Oscillospiraceae bacterium]
MGRNNIAGAWGEAVAAEYLKKKRFQLVCTGYRSRYGEIDLIVQNKKWLVFAEVKLRKSDSFAKAMEFVDFRKQNRLRTTASIYLAENPTELQPRFDVIEVYAPQGINTINPVIHHIEGAFE